MIRWEKITGAMGGTGLLAFVQVWWIQLIVVGCGVLAFYAWFERYRVLTERERRLLPPRRRRRSLGPTSTAARRRA